MYLSFRCKVISSSSNIFRHSILFNFYVPGLCGIRHLSLSKSSEELLSNNNMCELKWKTN